MSGRRIIAITKRIISQFRHDKRTIGLIVVVPVVLLSLLGFLLRSEAAPMPLGVVNEDKGIATPLGTISLAKHLADALARNKDLSVTALPSADVESQIRSGKVKAVVIFGPEFSARISSRQSPDVKVVLEGSNPSTSGSAMLALTRAFREAMPGLLGGIAGQPGPQGDSAGDPFQFSATYLYGSKEFDQLDFFAPVVIGFFAFFFVFLLSSVSFLRERSQGTLERLMASPVNRAEIAIGYMLGFSFFAIAQAIVILLFSVFVLRIHYAGSLLIVFVVEIILTIGAVNLGIFLSTFTRNELQVLQFIPLVITPQALLTGTFWPVEEMPVVLRELAYVLPITYANFALRDVMIKGLGFADPQVLFNLAVLVAFAALMLVFGALTLRRQVA